MFVKGEISYMQSLPPIAAGIFCRNTWNQRADKPFAQSFRLIHWGTLPAIEHLLRHPIPTLEISSVAYRNYPLNCYFMGGLGVEVIGEVTLAGNGDLGTWIVKSNGKPIKVTNAYDRLIFSPKDAVIPHEFVVNKWNPLAIHLDFNEFTKSYTDNELQCALQNIGSLAIQTGLPVFDTWGNKTIKL